MIYSLSYTEDLPANSDGCAKAWFVKIRPSRKDDKSIHAHEIDGHVAEWWMITLTSAVLLTALVTSAVKCGFPLSTYIFVLLSPFIQPILYRFCKRYRL